jgi:hypothetical protein
MNNCAACGKPVRLGGMKISINRRPGVTHYIAHLAGDKECDATRNYTCSAMKPYEKREEDKPYFKLIQRWNEANPVPPPAQKDAAP